MNLLKNLSDKGKTIVCVLHDLNAAMNYCNKTILLKAGKIFKQGDTESVLTKENIKEVYNIDAEIINLTDDRKPLIVYCSPY